MLHAFWAQAKPAALTVTSATYLQVVGDQSTAYGEGAILVPALHSWLSGGPGRTPSCPHPTPPVMPLDKPRPPGCFSLLNS